MCGLFAMFGHDDPAAARAMRDALAHRGPDDTGQWTGRHTLTGPATLGFNRLSIVGVEHGHQPFVTDDGRVHAVVNGEIYNYRELRAELGEHLFVTDSDAEVVAHLYAAHGARGLERLDGMFALVVYDSVAGAWVAMRDRYGIKPLWYARRDSGAAFGARWWIASEAKALHVAGVPGPDIRRLDPGHQLTIGGARPYYRLTPRALPSVDDPALLRTMLDVSVRRHLQADPDVKVATLLSGGLDSSAITALAARHRPDLVAYTFGTEDSPDVAAARRVAAHLDITHKVIPLDVDEVFARLPETVRVVESYNPMIVVETTAQTMAAERMAADGVKVALVGEGADELFRGYGVFRTRTPTDARRAAFAATRIIGNTEAQRVDYAMMRHSIEARPPFLDPMIVEYALNLPDDALLHDDGVQIWEKWALRRAVADLLPPDIVWRPKASLDAGSGVLGVLRRVRAQVSAHVLDGACLRYPAAHLDSPEATWLHDVFRSWYGDMGGTRVFEQHGSYPLLDDVIAARDLDGGGTGETVDPLVALIELVDNVAHSPAAG